MLREKCLGEFKAVLLLIWVVAVVALMTLVTFEVFSPQNNNVSFLRMFSLITQLFRSFFMTNLKKIIISTLSSKSVNPAKLSIQNMEKIALTSKLRGFSVPRP